MNSPGFLAVTVSTGIILGVSLVYPCAVTVIAVFMWGQVWALNAVIWDKEQRS